jgi:hypothetical protein
MPASAGVKVPVGDGQCLAERLGDAATDLLEDDLAWRRASVAGRREAQLTYDRQAARMLSDYSTVISVRRGGGFCK